MKQRRFEINITENFPTMSIAECGINHQRKQWLKSKSLQADRINYINDYPKDLFSL